MYFININITKHYFRLNLKTKKPTLCYCFTWIVFIELNFRVVFLLIRKTQDELGISDVNNSRSSDMSDNLLVLV